MCCEKLSALVGSSINFDMLTKKKEDKKTVEKIVNQAKYQLVITYKWDNLWPQLELIGKKIKHK